ncbi:DUF4332 domain-containing protein [candidate division KSB1 bacterium]|nr:DUF4332 domain-containing protein [candidate division KSB1 bacterium]
MAYYKLADIEGIGDKYAQKLGKAGLKSVGALLEKGATPKGRKEIAEKSGIDESLILKWVNHADLYRVKGVGSEYSDLLERAGVDTVKELKQRKPENLAAALKQTNDAKKIVRQVPSLVMVKKWIDYAKSLEGKITY